MSKEELSFCRLADITDCSADTLTDLKQVNLNSDLPVPMRMEQYLHQIRNPYLFRVDSLIVKVSFGGTRTLSSVLADLLTQC